MEVKHISIRENRRVKAVSPQGTNWAPVLVLVIVSVFAVFLMMLGR